MVTTDPNGTPHNTEGLCTATWQTFINPAGGTSYSFGHGKCGQPGSINRFIKATHSNRYTPVRYCTDHANTAPAK